MTAPTLYRSKYQQVASCLADGSRSVLDVGCRDGTLKKHLPASVSYTGVDLAPGPMVSQVCNLEKGLPF